MSIRLNKALRELNIGLQTAVEFLEKRKDLGEVKAEPSFKLSDQQYKALNDAFSQDKEVRDQAEKLITKKAKDKKRAPEQKDHRAESLLESSNQQQYKPLGKIDLDSIGKGKSVESAAKKSEAPKHETAAVSHAPVKDAHRNEPKHDQRSTHGSHQKQEMKQENQQKSQQPKMNDFKGQKNAAQGNKNVEAQQQNAEQKAADNSQPSSVFTLKSEKKYTSNEPKVLGKIDLSSLNQSTRPKKKSKEERRKEREEKLAQQHNDRKKRVRINKERVDINAEAKNNSADGNGQNKGNNGGNNKKNRNKNRNNNNNNNNNNNTSTTKKPAATVPQAPSDPKGTTPVSQHGQLSVKNGQLVDKSGKGYQLRGMSTHGLTWFPEFVNESAFKTLRDDWNTNVVRLAMYVDEWGNGQCYMGNKSGSLELLEKGVDICIKLDMYVIIDWHVLNPGDPSKYTNEAKSFFETVSKRYAKYPNVIYEICNEPNGGASWSGNIKPYAEKIIPVIRKNAPNSVIIVGTPTWSQEIDKPLSDPLNYKNVMYAFHFYAATHAGLRSNVENCVAQGLPVFVSEFGTCDASGGGANDFNETQKWLSYFDKQGISYCNWSICNKDETCSVLRPGTSANGNWSESNLTENGKWMRNWLKKH